MVLNVSSDKPLQDVTETAITLPQYTGCFFFRAGTQVEKSDMPTVKSV
jgi:hypothetical protein